MAWRIAIIGTSIAALIIVTLFLITAAIGLSRPGMPPAGVVFLGMLWRGVLASVVVALIAGTFTLILSYGVFPWLMRGLETRTRGDALKGLIALWSAAIFGTALVAGDGFVDNVVVITGLSSLPFLCYFFVGRRIWRAA